MSREQTYLDYNASAPLREEALEAMKRVFQMGGNASSVHTSGRKARGVIEAARKPVADLVEGIPANVIFTSGGTEANVMALSPCWLRAGKPFTISRVFVSAVEHPSVLSGGRFLKEQIEVIPVDAQGVIKLDALRDMLSSIPEGETSLVTVVAANSETGVLQPLQEIGVLVEDAGHLFHVDAVQMAGRLPVSMPLIGCNSLAVSSHKIGGPQGVGALILGKGDLRPQSLLTGGGQESWRRAGTENAAGIAGFAAAAQACLEDSDAERLAKLRQELENSLKSQEGDIIIFGEEAPRLPNTVSFACPGIPAETALINFDLQGIEVSSGSACSSGKVGASHVLMAMGYDEKIAKCAIRVSFGWRTSKEHLDKFLKAWHKICQRMSPKAKSQGDPLKTRV